MVLDTLFQRLHETQIASAIRENANAFPWIESVHVLSITLVFGTILIVDLRMLGYAAHRRGLRRLILDMLPFTWAAFVIAVVTGSLMFISNAVTYASNPQFQWKMLAILAAGINMAIFHMTAHRRIADWDEAVPTPLSARLSGATSLVLWMVVIVLGRFVGFTLAPF
jgi:hypothetical protein